MTDIICMNSDDTFPLGEIDVDVHRRPMRKCSLNPDHPMVSLGDERLLPVILPSSEIQDFHWTWTNNCLVTDRVADLLRESDLLGYELKPATITKIKRMKHGTTEFPMIWELRVTGWGGVASEKSGIRLVEARCPDCGYSRYGPLEDPARVLGDGCWDGSDFFIIWPLPLFILVTERVRAFVKQHRLLNVTFAPFNEMNIGHRGFSPGRLSFYMSKERAKELGGPLGID
jgi:hypothetical protein